MASKQQMGYKCRIAGVLLFLFTGIAALIAVAVIQKTWRFKEYSLEVSTCPQIHIYPLAKSLLTFTFKSTLSAQNASARERQRHVFKYTYFNPLIFHCECVARHYPDVRSGSGEGGFSSVNLVMDDGPDGPCVVFKEGFGVGVWFEAASTAKYTIRLPVFY